LSANKNKDLAVEGKDYGTTDIAYSPSIIAGNILVYTPIENLAYFMVAKFVGEQYMNNIELPAKLADYFVNDLNVAYTFKPKSIFKEIIVMVL
jgi:iron complex outermembrane receptor protein